MTALWRSYNIEKMNHIKNFQLVLSWWSLAATSCAWSRVSDICLFKLSIYDQTMLFESSNGHKSSAFDSFRKAINILNLDSSMSDILSLAWGSYPLSIEPFRFVFLTFSSFWWAQSGKSSVFQNLDILQNNVSVSLFWVFCIKPRENNPLYSCNFSEKVGVGEGIDLFRLLAVSVLGTSVIAVTVQSGKT